VVFAEQLGALIGRLVVDQVGVVGGEDLVDERTVVGRLEGGAAQHHVDLDRRVAVIEVDEGLGGALA